MGSMGGGGGFRREGSQGEKADMQMPPTNPAPTDNTEAAPQRDFRQMSANRSESAMPNQQILLIGSSVILLAGILFALFFKRRK